MALNCRKILAAICCIVVIAAVAIGLGVGFTVYKSHSSSSQNGPYLLGDHILTEQQQQIRNLSLPVPTTGNDTAAAASISMNAIFWPSPTIPYQFDPSLSSTLVSNAQTAMQRITAATCIKFVQRTSTSQTNFIYFLPYSTAQNGGACQSMIGMNANGPNQINMGSQCDPGRCTHEILHALGFNHEHVRPDRNSYVSFHPENIDPTLTDIPDLIHVNFDILTTTTVNTPYDLLSIMHYPLNGFAKPGGYQTLELVNSNFPSKDQIGQLTLMSDGDVQAINALYCGSSPSTTPKPTVPPSAGTAVAIPCTSQAQCPANGFCSSQGYCDITAGTTPCNSQNQCYVGQYCRISGASGYCAGCVSAPCSTSTSVGGSCAVCTTTCVALNTPVTPNQGNYKLVGAFASSGNALRPWYQASIGGTTIHMFAWGNSWVVSYSSPLQTAVPDATHYAPNSNVAMPTAASGWEIPVNGQWSPNGAVSVSISTC